MKLLILISLMLIVGSTVLSAQEMATKVPDLAQLQKMTARFAPTELKVDISGLSKGDRKALAKLIEAARLIDPIFMQRVLERRSGALRQAAEGHLAAGQSAAALFLDQQRAVVGAGLPVTRRRGN